MKDQLSDHRLIQKILDGDTQAFEEVIDMTEGLVVGIVHKMITDIEQRKDLIQEIYLKVFHSLYKFKFKSKLSTWVGAISYNTCLDHLNKKKLVLNELEDIMLSVVTTESRIIQAEREIILQQEIDKLSTLYKTIITLFHQQQLSYKEIGEITNLPEGTLKNYLFRARKKLKENLLQNYKKEDL